jgi:hypothetical protein
MSYTIDNGGQQMNTKYKLIILANIIVSTIVVLLFLCNLTLTYDVTSNKYEFVQKGDYLAISVSLMGIITTIAITLAAYKVISSKDVNQAVSDKFNDVYKEYEIKYSKLEADNRNTFVEIKKEIDSFARNHVTVLSENIEEFLSIIHDISKFNFNKIFKEIDHKVIDKNILKTIYYIDHMNIEIMSTFRMFLLISSSSVEDKIIGYNLLTTLEDQNLKTFFLKMMKNENELIVKQFLYDEIHSMDTQ